MEIVKETALMVANELMEKDALGALVRDELGISELNQAKPIQAAFSSGTAIFVGGHLPFLVTIFAPFPNMEYFRYIITIISLLAAIIKAH